jgi:hypothetical protein
MDHDGPVGGLSIWIDPLSALPAYGGETDLAFLPGSKATVGGSGPQGRGGLAEGDALGEGEIVAPVDR